MQWAKTNKGFTIVELLIVIVVIAILAAITIVAYNGISDRTKRSAAQTATSQAVRKIQLYAAENSDTYPATLNDAGLVDSGTTTYQYSVNNSVSPRTFCLTVTVNSISYYQNSSTAQNPTEGACSGHGLNGLPPNLAINPSFETSAAAVTLRTNLTTNPSFETGSTGWGVVNGGTGASVATSTTRAHSGTTSLLYTYGDGTAADSGASSSITASSGVTYTLSAWVYAPASIASGLKMIAFGSALGNTLRGSTVTTVGSWARVSVTVTTVAAGTLSFAVGKEGSGAVDTGKTVFIDSVLAEAVTGINGYFSGATAASGDSTFAWTGTANASTSREVVTNIANFNQNGSGNVRFQSSERSTHGSASGRVETVTASNNAGLYQGMTLDAGTYTFIAKVWIEPGFSPNVSLTSQGTGVTIGAVAGYPGSTTTQGQWVELRKTFTIPASTNVNSFVYITGAQTAIGGSFWVDEYAVVLGECTASVCY
mgnify:CR=1 FL=1